MPTPMLSPATEPVVDVEYTTILQFQNRSVIVNRERLRIGSSPVCEIQLSHGPLLHSILFSDAGVLWVEADDLITDLEVNDHPCQRMALRDGDTVCVDGEDFTVRLPDSHSMLDEAALLASDLTQLTAEELCDRILSEQTMVDEFETGRRQGWQNLMSAMHEVALDSVEPGVELHPLVRDQDPNGECERLLEQIHEISATMTGRTQELDVCESELEAATSLLQETQERVSQQIQELLDQIGSVSPRELRASA